MASPRERAKQFLARIRASRDRLRATAPQADSPAFLDGVRGFLSILGEDMDDGVWAQVETLTDLAAWRTELFPWILAFTWAEEDLSYRAALASPSDVEGTLGDRLGPSTRGAYRRMADCARLTDFSRCSAFIMMGCGRVPGSLFYLHDWTPVPRLVGIDRDPASLEASRALVHRFGLDRIEIREADACQVDYREFDLIYWDPFVTDRTGVMARILATARPGTQVILRDPWKTGNFLFEPMANRLHPRFRIRAESTGFPGRFRLQHLQLDLAPT